MVSAKHSCEHHEEECQHDEEHPGCLHMVELFFIFCQIESSEPVSTARHLESTHQLHCLYEKEKPKLAVVEFSNTASYPEAMVVKFAHASPTVLAMTGTEWHHQLASLTEPSIGQLYIFLGGIFFGFHWFRRLCRLFLCSSNCSAHSDWRQLDVFELSIVYWGCTNLAQRTSLRRVLVKVAWVLARSDKQHPRGHSQRDVPKDRVGKGLSKLVPVAQTSDVEAAEHSDVKDSRTDQRLPHVSLHLLVCHFVFKVF